MPVYPQTKPAQGIYAPAYQAIARAITQGASRYEELVSVVQATLIKDRLVHPAAARFVTGPDGTGLRIDYQNGLEHHTCHDHALQALAQKAEIPIGYVRRLLTPSPKGESPVWRSNLLVENLNRSFGNIDFGQKGDPRFLHRIVGTELRGFLSRRFNRHIASAPLLRAFVAASQDAGAVPFDARATPVKFYLKTYIPEVFEPVPGEFVAVGVEWSNSDFGAGRMQVALSLWRSKTGGFTVLDKVLSKVHIGSVMSDGDIEISEETARKEADAQASAIADAVRAQLDPEYVTKVLAAIEEAHQDQIPWDRLKGQLAKILNKKELEAIEKLQGVQDLPPILVNGDLIPTRWWVSSALAKLSQDADSPERAVELERASGNFLKTEVK
jgi:hypothetical protein